MGLIGFIPTKTTIAVREPDGDGGTIPAATEAAAGVMTAEQCKRLNEVWSWHQASSSDAPVVIERSADTSQFLTRIEARQLLSQFQRPTPTDANREIAQLRAQVQEISGQVTRDAQSLMVASPAVDVEDARARQVLEAVIAQFEALDHRVSRLENIINTLGSVAQAKAAEAA